MALSDYTPVYQWYADALTDLDDPTGTTKSNPGALTDPTIAGAGDQYAEFDGTNGLSFLPASPLLEVNTGDLTLVVKARVDTFASDVVLFANHDGAGSSGSSHGYLLQTDSAANRVLSLKVPPRGSSFEVQNSSLSLVAGQDFIIAFRRSSGTWTIWLDADASGGMVADTPSANTAGSSEILACGDISFGCDRAGAKPLDGRIYWHVAFAEAISDTDIQLADWDDEANLKAAWLGAAGVSGIGNTGLATRVQNDGEKHAVGVA